MRLETALPVRNSTMDRGMLRKAVFLTCFKRETLADNMEVCYNTPNESE